MYGKTFQSLWRGSMRGKPLLQLVFIYMFCNCDQDGVYDCVPQDIADATGLDITEVLNALAELEKPDVNSRTPDNDGRRIIQLYPHRTWGWRIPNHAYYRHLGSMEQRKEKAAERQRRFRSNASVTHSNATVTPASVSVSASASKEGIGQGEEYPADFIAFWEAYPNKTGKIAALKCWQKATKTATIPDIMAGLAKAKTSDQWTKDGGKYIPHPATWLNQGRWMDEPAQAKQRSRMYD